MSRHEANGDFIKKANDLVDRASTFDTIAFSKSTADLLRRIQSQKELLLGDAFTVLQKSNLEHIQTSLKAVYADKDQFNINEVIEAYRNAFESYVELGGLSNNVNTWNKTYEYMVNILNPTKVNFYVENSVKLFSNIALQTYAENYRSLMNAMESGMFSFGKLLEPLQLEMDLSALFISISKKIIQRNYTEEEQTEFDLFDMVNKTYEDCYTQETDNLEEGFKSNEEFKEAFKQHCSNPIGFQERTYNWTEKMIKQFFIA